MSETEILVNNQNFEMLQKIAKVILSNEYENCKNIKNIEELINFIVKHKFKELNIYPIKTESHIDIDLKNGHSDSRTIPTSNEDLWIFGYGSLVWKADFPYVSREIGVIRGFERKFYQNSIDHRGTATKPGRVVTLIRSANPNSMVWGVAYRIAKDNKDEVLNHLDFREKNGYQRYSVKFYPYIHDDLQNKEREIIIYIASEENESYAGRINDLDAITDQIYSAVGPSGTNREYVYKLANAMRLLFPGEHDDHLFELEKKLRNREKEELLLAERIKKNLTITIKNAIQGGLTLNEIILLIESEFETGFKTVKY